MTTHVRSLIGGLALLVGLPAAFSATATFHAAVLGDNPLLWYQLAEASGNVVNHGSLGAAYNAAVFGTPVRQSATIGGDAGIAFNSTDDFLESLGSSTLTGNPTFSIETLIFLPASGSAGLWGPYLHWGDGGGGDGNLARNGREVYFSAQSNNNNRTYAGFYNAGLRTQSPVPTIVGFTSSGRAKEAARRAPGRRSTSMDRPSTWNRTQI